jgi:PKD repeat protein
VTARRARSAAGPKGRHDRRPGRVVLAIALLVAALLPVGSLANGSDGPASCSFTVSVLASPATGPSPLLVHFNASVSSGVPSEYDWNFGDGSYWNSTLAGAASPLHRYANPGEYHAIAHVIEPGCSGDGSSTVAATPGVLLVAVSTSATSGLAPLTVEFSATISGGTGTYVSALWAFGDGGVGSGLPVAYTYSQPGTYSYRVNVTDSDGHWATSSGTETVEGATSGGSSSGWLGGSLSEETALAAIAATALVVGVLLFFVGRRTASRAAPRNAFESGTAPPSPHPFPPADAPTPAAAPSGSPGPTGDSPKMETAPEPGVLGPPTGGRASATDSAEAGGRVQLTQRVILHIGGQGRIGPEDVGLATLTQSGMAAALGVGQNSLTNVLRRLVAAGVLVQDVRHVSGQPRRLRVYRFSSRGEAVYRDVRRRVPPSGRPPGGDPAEDPHQRT